MIDKSQDRSPRGPRLTSFLYKLAKVRNIVPPSIYIEGATRQGTHAVGGGGFSDVWKGHYSGEPVALKVLRTFGSNETIKKVSISCRRRMKIGD